MESHYAMLSQPTALSVAAQEDVLRQLEKELESLANQQIDAHVYRWILDDDPHRVYWYDPELQQFLAQ